MAAALLAAQEEAHVSLDGAPLPPVPAKLSATARKSIPPSCIVGALLGDPSTHGAGSILTGGEPLLPFRGSVHSAYIFRCGTRAHARLHSTPPPPTPRVRCLRCMPCTVPNSGAVATTEIAALAAGGTAPAVGHLPLSLPGGTIEATLPEPLAEKLASRLVGRCGSRECQRQVLSILSTVLDANP